jgi:hypothetical protein
MCRFTKGYAKNTLNSAREPRNPRMQRQSFAALSEVRFFASAAQKVRAGAAETRRKPLLPVLHLVSCFAAALGNGATGYRDNNYGETASRQLLSCPWSVHYAR